MGSRGEVRRFGTVVVGGGQAGLATSYWLSRLGEDHVVLDAGDRVGDPWRRRWDSLSLFTPARYDGLPGMAFPASRGAFPTKEQVADYLEVYAREHALPVELESRVERLARDGGGFRAGTDRGDVVADRVVLATGTNPRPRVPPFAGELSPDIRQLHSSEYRNPGALPRGETLVVGAGTSGVEIALDLAADRPVSISGRPTFHVPDALLRYAGGPYWWFVSNVLTVRTPIGRKARGSVRRGGGPLVRVSAADLDRAGVERLPRVAGAQGGRPLLEDGRVVSPVAVVWATGFRPDFSWIAFPVTDESGWPAGERGVSTLAPGLYFVGMLFQYGLTSGLLGGVGRDAAYVARKIHQARAALRRSLPEAAPHVRASA